jgi:DnaK suppressor protein
MPVGLANGKAAKLAAGKGKTGGHSAHGKPAPPAKQLKKPAMVPTGPGKAKARPLVKASTKPQALPAPKQAPGKPARISTANGKVPATLARKIAIELPVGYRPSEREPFMNELQRTYFRRKLVAWKEEILREGRSTLLHLHEDTSQHADLADRATSETDRAIELRARDRQRKLIAKIDLALLRIEDGTYGYCEETGEPIGLKRLDARPIATLSLEAQERHERRERVYRDERAE